MTPRRSNLTLGSCIRTALAAVMSFALVGAASVVAAPAGRAQAGSPVTNLFTSLPPTRVLDTRDPAGLTAGYPFDADGTNSIDLSGAPGLPANATAVVLNITVTQPEAAGYLTVFPHNTVQPLASNLNFTPGQTVPNLVVVPVGSNGFLGPNWIDIYNGSAGTVHVIADLSGYFSPSSGAPVGSFDALDPSRFLDTRSAAAAAPNSTTQFLAWGVNGVPSGATAVVVNVTVTEPQAAGYITAYGDGTAQPLASNLNFSPGQTVPNLVVVPVGPDGYVDLYNGSSGTVQLIADVSGYFTGAPPTSAGEFGSVSPSRLLDTRDGTGQASAGAVAPGGTVHLVADGVGGVPTGVSAVVLNVTVTGPQSAGYITAYADGSSQPLASNLNFTPGQTVPNLVVVPVGVNGTVDLYNGSSGTVQLIADVSGYFY